MRPIDKGVKGASTLTERLEPDFDRGHVYILTGRMNSSTCPTQYEER